MEKLHNGANNLKTLVVTRPLGEGIDTAKFIRENGWEPFLLHTIELKPLDPLKVIAQAEALVSSGPFDWAVFMSSRGVRLFLSALKGREELSARILGRSRIVAVGPATRAELAKHGIDNVSIPDRYSSEGVSELLSRVNLDSSRVLLLRSSDASSELADSLQSREASVSTINLYYSSVPSDKTTLLTFLAGLRTGRFQAVLFTSALSANNLFQMAKDTVPLSEVVKSLGNRLVGAIGPVTAKKLRQFGVECLTASKFVLSEAINEVIEAHKLKMESDPLTP